MVSLLSAFRDWRILLGLFVAFVAMMALGTQVSWLDLVRAGSDVMAGDPSGGPHVVEVGAPAIANGAAPDAPPVEGEIDRPAAPPVGRVERIELDPDEPPDAGWDPPPWAIAVATGGSILVVGMLGAALVWIRAAAQDER